MLNNARHTNANGPTAGFKTEDVGNVSMPATVEIENIL